MRPIHRPVVRVTMILLLALGSAPLAARKQPIEKYQASTVATEGPAGSASITLNINIYAWSDEEDREIVLDAIQEAQENRRAYRAVPDALRKLGKAGHVFLAGGSGWPIRYASTFEFEDRRGIVLTSDRPPAAPSEN